MYVRVLRLRHLRLRPAAVLLLFEGSVALAIVLALAEIVHLWGIVAVPVAVAAMVKFNDVVAGMLTAVPGVRPLAPPPDVARREIGGTTGAISTDARAVMADDDS